MDNDPEEFEQQGVEDDLPDNGVRISPLQALNCTVFLLDLADDWPGADKIVIEGADMERFQRLIDDIADYQHPTAH